MPRVVLSAVIVVPFIPVVDELKEEKNGQIELKWDFQL